MQAVMICSWVARVVLTCAVGAAALVVSSLQATPALVQSPEVGAGDVPSAADGGTRSVRGADPADRVARLLATHDCWSDDAPAGAPVPAHAVVTTPGGQPRLVEASVGFGIWLEGEPGVLHGFCP